MSLFFLKHNSPFISLYPRYASQDPLTMTMTRFVESRDLDGYRTARLSKPPLHTLSAQKAFSLIRQGHVSVEEYANELLQHIKERDPVVHAWAYLNPSLVLAQARNLDKILPEDRGPLHGVAIGIKDVLLTKGKADPSLLSVQNADSQADMPTRYGSPIYQDEPAFGPDATSVAALRAAGALIMGKTRTTEFAATAVGGPCANPSCPGRTPGGSSSGSAAVVADHQVPLAIGTQTGGSIVRPGAFCGIYAFKVSGCP